MVLGRLQGNRLVEALKVIFVEARHRQADKRQKVWVRVNKESEKSSFR